MIFVFTVDASIELCLLSALNGYKWNINEGVENTSFDGVVLDNELKRNERHHLSCKVGTIEISTFNLIMKRINILYRGPTFLFYLRFIGLVTFEDLYLVPNSLYNSEND